MQVVDKSFLVKSVTDVTRSMTPVSYTCNMFTLLCNIEQKHYSEGFSSTELANNYICIKQQ